MYRLIKNSEDVIREADGAHIPSDPGNMDRADYAVWVAAGGEPLPAIESPEPVPSSISDRQFFQQLAIEGTITTGEALAAVKTGEIPAALQGFVDALDPEQKFAAEMLLSGATVFERAHPLTEEIGRAQGRSKEQVDNFFRAASVL